MALLYGNPNQITFTFDAIYNSTKDMNDRQSDIMLGRFVLVSDEAKNLSYINMRTVDGYQQIGVVPKSSTEYVKINSVDLTINATEIDDFQYQLSFNTNINVTELSWNGTGYTEQIKNIQDESPVLITFADSDEINFFTDKNGSIKLGLNTKSITTDKIADETITADKMSFTAKNILAWWQKLGLDTTVQDLQSDIKIINNAIIPIEHEVETINNELSTVKESIKAQAVEVTPKISSGTHIATIKVGNNSSKIYAPEAQSGIDEDSLQKYLQDNKYTTENRVKELIDSRDYVTPGFVAENYVSKGYATENFITKSEVTGTIKIIGFNEYRNETEALLVNIYNISGAPIFNNPIGSDITLNDIPYGKYFVAKVDAIGDTGKDYQIDETYPKIYCTVGYNSIETINVADWASYELNSNSWERIKYIASIGKANEYWALGDTKDITLDKTYKATILDFDHDGENTITFGLCDFSNGPSVSLNYSSSCLYEGIYATSQGAIPVTTLQNDINNFTQKLLTNIESKNLKLLESTNKQIYNNNTVHSLWSDNNSNRYVFIPSDFEILGSWSNENLYYDKNDKQYSFFSNNSYLSTWLYNKNHNPNFVSATGYYSWRLAFRRSSGKQISSYSPRYYTDGYYQLNNDYGLLQHSPVGSTNTFDYLFMWVVG